MSSKTNTLGLLPLGRSTFDVDYAEERLALMLDLLENSGQEIIGPKTLLFDGDATTTAIDKLVALKPDNILVLQVTFTDAGSIAELASKTEIPLLIWSIPEPRAGDRLRLNSFCGLNLASHTLGLLHRPFAWMYTAPESSQAEVKLNQLLRGDFNKKALTPLLPEQAYPGVNSSTEEEKTKARNSLQALQGKKIARIGEHPPGFSTCQYDATALNQATGITVDEHPIGMLFDNAKLVDKTQVDRVREKVAQQVSGLDKVDQEQLTRSLKLTGALETLSTNHAYDAFALRCWPETFTEYGGAACGAAAMLGENRVPCACEADVYGSVTQLLLQEISNQPVFLVDLVDVDVEDNTAVVWHCGQAPISMCAKTAKPRATIHTNRKMPLLYEFPLRAGQVTLLRWSQAAGQQQLMIASAEMLERKMSFTGTSGVLKFTEPAETVLERVISSGLEHHVALVYGDFTQQLAQIAAVADLPVTRLS